MGFYLLSGLLLHTGLGLFPTLAAAKLVSQSRPFYGYTNTPKYLRFMSALFPISGITSLQHTDSSEHLRLSRTLEHSAVLISFAFSVSSGEDRIPIKDCASHAEDVLYKQDSFLLRPSFLSWPIALLCSPHPFCP